MRHIEHALEMLKKGQTNSISLSNSEKLVTLPNAVVIRYYNDSYSGAKYEQELLAVKVGPTIIGNSSALTGLQRHRDTRRTETAEQLTLAELIPMIPFTVIKQAGLNLGTFSEVESGPEETLLRKESRHSITRGQVEELKDFDGVSEVEIEEIKPSRFSKDQDSRFNVTYLRSQHFAGARLFTVDRRLFLLDVDRVELKHHRINPFLVELQDTRVQTISEAYESLKPEQVRFAERQGLRVKRQGEWFLIPVSQLQSKRASKVAADFVAEQIKKADNKWDKDLAKRNGNQGILQAGQNRPNRVEMFVEINGEFFVKGLITHTGREHEDIKLKDFHQAVPNTSITSWTITGDLD